VAVVHKHFKWQRFTQSDLFTYNAKYFQTVSEKKLRSFAKNFRSVPKLRFTLHEVAWQFNHLACSSGVMFSRVISAISFRSLFTSNWLSKRTELYWNSSEACFLNHTFRFCKILDESCSKKWHAKKKMLEYRITGTTFKRRTT